MILCNNPEISFSIIKLFFLLLDNFFIYIVYCVNSLCFGKRCGECLITQQCSWCKDRVSKKWNPYVWLCNAVTMILTFIYNNQNFTKTRCATNGNLSAEGCINIVQRKDHVVTLIKVTVNVNLVPNYSPTKLRQVFVIYIYE